MNKIETDNEIVYEALRRDAKHKMYKHLLYTVIFSTGFIQFFFLSKDRVATAITIGVLVVLKTFVESIYSIVENYLVLRGIELLKNSKDR